MIKKQQKFLIHIVPLVRIPLTRDQAFFYTAPDKFSFGAHVEIPIGKRTTQGIVISSKKDFARAGGMNLKPVGKLLSDNTLTLEQYTLAQFISSYYLTSLGVVLKNFSHMPTTPRTKLTTIPVEQKDLPILSTEEIASLKDVLHTLKKKHSCLVQTTYNAFSSDWLIHVIAHYKKASNGSLLIFVPERTLIPLYEHLLLTHFPSSDIITLSTSLTKGHFSQRLRDIAQHKHKIILTTRVGLFAPFHDLAIVITVESHDMSHKQWAKNPRYDVRTCAPELAQIHNAHHLSVSPSPRIAQRESAIKNNLFVALPQTDIPKLSIVDMKIEYFEKNKDRHTKKRPLLSDKLLCAIKSTLANIEQSLLFINHQGKSAFSTCEKCKTVLRCTTCERALVERTSGKFSCLHCSFSTSIFPSCPACGNLTFVSIGVGTENIEELLRKQFPKARIARVDSESMKEPKAYEKLFADFYNGEIDILIGTQMATKGWEVPRLTLAAIIDMDQVLGGTDYDTDEKAYAHILQLGSRVGSRGALIIQVFDTLHNVITSAQKNQLQEFAEEELAMRELLNYPPYAKLVKLTCKSSISSLLEQDVDHLYEELTTLCAGGGIIISEPHDPLVNKVRTQYLKQIIITIKKKDITKDVSLPQELHDKLITLKPHWTIDIDPVTIS